MQLTMMKGKLHRATVTNANLEYEGSVAISTDLLEAASILPFEQVDIWNITNGERFTTYAIPADAGSGTISVQGAAAHKVSIGDKVIIAAWARMSEAEAKNWQPKAVLMDENNKIKRDAVGSSTPSKFAGKPLEAA